MNALRNTAVCLSLLAIIAIGCDKGTPTDPPTDVDSPSFQADQYWEHGSFNVDGSLFIECAGETMRFFGEVPYRWHHVTSSSGTYNYHLQFPGWAQSPPFYAQGQSSGRLFRFKAGPYNESFHSSPGEVVRFKVHERYVADKGDWLEATAFYHVTVNANGELAVEKDLGYEWRCHFND